MGCLVEPLRQNMFYLDITTQVHSSTDAGTSYKMNPKLFLNLNALYSYILSIFIKKDQ